MKVFMYDEVVINLAAVETITTCTPDRKSGEQSIWFEMRNGNSKKIYVPTTETKKILKEIYEKMLGD